jgi:hypothetical protein
MKSHKYCTQRSGICEGWALALLLPDIYSEVDPRFVAEVSTEALLSQIPMLAEALV